MHTLQVFIEDLQLEGQLTPAEFLHQRETALEKLFPTAELMPGACHMPLLLLGAAAE